MAESIKLYGRHFLRALPLGILVAAINQLTTGTSRGVVTVALLVTAPLFSAAYGYAARLVTETQAPLRSWVVAIVGGSLVFVPAALFFPCGRPGGILACSITTTSSPTAVISRRSEPGVNSQR